MEELNHINYRAIKEIPYEQLFFTIQYNGNTLDETERLAFVKRIDEDVEFYVEGINMAAGYIDEGFAETTLGTIQQTIFSTLLYTTQVTADCIVASKYFLLANTDYDKRYMRGKYKIILNEGFKQLYGFCGHKNPDTGWGKLKPIIHYFPQKIQEQYKELTNRLETLSKSSSWWKEERDIETHYDVQKIVRSRREEIIESKVMIESLPLINALKAVGFFVQNANACVLNMLLGAYKRGELKEE